MDLGRGIYCQKPVHLNSTVLPIAPIATVRSFAFCNRSGHSSRLSLCFLYRNLSPTLFAVSSIWQGSLAQNNSTPSTQRGGTTWVLYISCSHHARCKARPAGYLPVATLLLWRGWFRPVCAQPIQRGLATQTTVRSLPMPSSGRGRCSLLTCFALPSTCALPNSIGQDTEVMVVLY